MFDEATRQRATPGGWVRNCWRRYTTWRRADGAAPAAAPSERVLKADIADKDLNQQSRALSKHMELGG